VAKRGSSRRGRPARAEVYRLIPGYDPFTTAGDCTFDHKAAKRAIDFFHECLTFTTGEWMDEVEAVTVLCNARTQPTVSVPSVVKRQRPS